MSYDVSVFFNAPNSLEELVNRLEKLWSVTFHQSDRFDDVYQYNGFGLIISIIGEHGLVDHSGILFSAYQYEITVKTFVRPNTKNPTNLIRDFAFWIAYELHERFNWPCIVVEEVQELILELNSP